MLTALLLLLSCSPEPLTTDSGGARVELQVTKSAVIDTVAAVQWDRVGAVSARVEFQPVDGDGGGSVLAAQVGDTWQATVVGMKPDRDYLLRAWGSVDGEEVLLGDASFTTGPLPSWLPALTVDGEGPGKLLTTLLGPQSTIVMLDADGDIVWWVQTPLAEHFVIRARADQAGGGVLALSQPSDDADNQDPAALLRIPWSGEGIEVLNLQGGHHDFVQTGDEEIVYIAGQTVNVDGVDVYGDQLIRRDADGSMNPVWSAWDHDAPDVDQTGTDWTHANALDWLPDTGRLLLGMRNLSTIVEIDPQSHQPIWQIGGGPSMFEFGEGATFIEQHQFEWLAHDRLLIFDNGEPTAASSRIVELSLDWEHHLAEVAWEYRPDPALYCFGPGEVVEVDDGDRLVSWGSAGIIERVVDDVVTWRVEAPLGTAFGYIDVVAEAGAPRQ